MLSIIDLSPQCHLLVLTAAKSSSSICSLTGFMSWTLLTLESSAGTSYCAFPEQPLSTTGLLVTLLVRFLQNQRYCPLPSQLPASCSSLAPLEFPPLTLHPPFQPPSLPSVLFSHLPRLPVLPTFQSPLLRLLTPPPPPLPPPPAKLHPPRALLPHFPSCLPALVHSLAKINHLLAMMGLVVLFAKMRS